MKKNNETSLNKPKNNFFHTLKNFFSRCFKAVDKVCNIVFDVVINFFKKHYMLITFLVVLVISLVIRIMFIDYVSEDMNVFLRPWLNYMKANGHFAALKTYPNWNGLTCDYPVGYMNFLGFLSLFKGDTVSQIKVLSFIFDYLLVFGGFLVVKQFSKSKFVWLVTVCALMLFPTGILNSALWGQCDSLYTCMIVFSIYFLLKGKNNIAMIFFGIGLSCKVQAVFFLPVLIYLWINRKFKLRSLLIAFFVVFLSFVPSYIAGAPFAMPFEMFTTLIGKYTNPNYGAANMYAFFDFLQITDGLLKGAGTLFALLVCGLVIVLLHHYKVDFSKKNLIYVATLFSLICPFVLPHMHERYFFFADVMLIIYVIVFKRKYILAVLMSFSSILCYTHFLFGSYIFKFLGTDSIRVAALITLGIIITLIYDAKNLKKNNQEEIIEQIS